MDFLTRRSIRKYQDRKVEKEVIEQLMKTAKEKSELMVKLVMKISERY